MLTFDHPMYFYLFILQYTVQLLSGSFIFGSENDVLGTVIIGAFTATNRKLYTTQNVSLGFKEP